MKMISSLLASINKFPEQYYIWEAQGQCFWTNIIVNILKVQFFTFFSFNHSQGKKFKYNEKINKMETNYLVLVG